MVVNRANRRPFLLLILALLCAGGPVFAQHENNNLYSDYRPYTTIPGTYYGNDCLALFYDTIGHSQVRFKAVVLNLYSYSDSTFKNKKFVSKTTITFNKKGKKELSVRIDSTNKIVDSVRDIYNAAGDKIRETEYGYVTTKEWLQLISDEVVVWNAKGNLVKDSVVKRNESWSETNMKEFETNYSYYTYDDSGEVTSTAYYTDNDTTFLSVTKEGAYKIIRQKSLTSYGAVFNYGKYDAQGRELETRHVSANDTVITKSLFDANGRITELDTYTNGRLTHMILTDYQKDGGYTETENELPLLQDGATCPNNTKTVTVYNKDSVEMSKVSIAENEGRPITTTTNYFYKFQNKNIIFDSAVTTQSGYLYSSTSISITTRKFDSKNRPLEETVTGGGETAENSKRTWSYNKLGNLLEGDTYGSCLDKPSSVERYTYYPDDKKVKEQLSVTGDNKTYLYFGEDTRFTSETDISPGQIYRLIYEYVK